MFRENIKKAMKDQNVRVLQIAKVCGINDTSISSFLSGARTLRHDDIEKMVSYLGLTFVPKKCFRFHSDYLEKKEAKRQARIAARRNE